MRTIFKDEKRYKDLKLSKIRDEAGLDFAHYTYQNGMCSCCYTPKDLPALYWAGKTPAEKRARRDNAKRGEYSYILFKNANNGSGVVKSTDIICHRNTMWSSVYTDVCIEWLMTEEQLEKVCQLLQEQLGSGYHVIKPDNEDTCIIVSYVGEGTKK